MPKKPRDIAASVRQRLLNKSKAASRPFQEVLQYYAMERFLYRLSKSRQRSRFVLKGALMLSIWHGPEARPTMDVDLLGKTRNEPSDIVRHMEEILRVPVEPDGILFQVDTMATESITEGADYEGIRIRFRGSLATASVHMQIDIGFGDVVYPKPRLHVLPTSLGLPAPRLLAYTRESVIAEKFEAILKLGELNSRMKDFYDIWLLSRSFDFEERTLAEAIRLTFERRGTELTTHIPAFSDRFAEAKRAQWNAFVRRIQRCGDTPDFGEVTSDIAHFLSPVMVELQKSTNMQRRWKPPGPWR